MITGRSPDAAPVVRVGLLGYGFAGATFHAPLIQATPGLTLAAVVSTRLAAGTLGPGVRVLPTAAAVWADPTIDLVVIATPHPTHAALADQALRAGKHVVVDKPFVVDSADGAALIALAAQTGRVLSVFHNRRWDNDFLTVQAALQAHLLGEVLSYTAHYDRYRPQVRDRWREQPGPGSGLLYDLGAHLIDQALVLFGPPATVFADLAAQRAGAQSDDYFHVLLGYGRRKVLLHGSMLVAAPGPRFLIHGTTGSLQKSGTDSQEAALLAGQRPDTPGWGLDTPEQYATLVRYADGTPVATRLPTLPGAYPAYYAGIHAAIVHGQPPPVPATEALQVIQVIEAAQASHAQQRVIAFAP